MGCGIITGGGGGIGKAIAMNLAKEKLNIVITYIGGNEQAESTCKEIQQLGVKAIAIQSNVSDEQSCAEVVAKAIEAFGSVDVLVNNAGITKDGLLLRMKHDDFTSVIDVNLTGTFNMIKAVSRVMTRAKKGRIINISSIVGEIGNTGQCNYSASKAGVIGLTKSAARELAPRNITVNAIAPGFIETDMTAVLPDEIKEAMLSSIPLKAFGKPEDIASLAAFLSSERAGYITGQVINVCGGMVM